MAIERGGSLGRQFRGIFEGGAAAGMTDGELLERLAARGGEGARSAFAALIARHGPMVLGACRARSRDVHDADDAFQAVFLVLARKAGSLGPGDSLGPWLHGVALRTTAAARVAAARRRALDRRRAGAAGPGAPAEEAGAGDLLPLIHEELGRLPANYRTPLVLCDLQGLSHEEAARRLGWPVGTVKSRQARGRERLRGRLIRRGVAPSAILLGANLGRAAVPAALAEATAEAACLAAVTNGAVAAAGAVPAASTLLARKVSTTMMISRWQAPALGLLLAGTLAFGASRLPRGEPQAPPAEGGPGTTRKAQASDPPRPPGSLFQLRITADATHDADAVAKAMAAGRSDAPVGYFWVRYDPATFGSTDGLIVRDFKPGPGPHLLVRRDRQDINETDLARVEERIDPEARFTGVAFRLTRSGSIRFGELTRAHLPENGGEFKYRLAIIVEGAARTAPMINSEIRDAGLIHLSGMAPAKAAAEAARITKLLSAHLAPDVD